uniref:Uncharacterized protein n=1 Tax=Salarias fasciatus TaxID=181472 RepID=A0A672HVA4_SALFA
MASLPSRSQSPGCGAVSPSRMSLRTSQGSTYDSPVLSEPRPLAAVFPGTTMPPSCPSPASPGSAPSPTGGGAPTGSPPRAEMTAVPQHLGSTLPRQSRPLAYGADPYGLFQRSALPRPDSLIGLHSSYGGHGGQVDPELRAALSPDCHMTPLFDQRSFHSPLFHSPAHEAQAALYRTAAGLGTLPRTTSHCGTLPYQSSSYGLNPAGYLDSFRAAAEPGFPHRHSGLERAVTPTPSIESLHKDPRWAADQPGPAAGSWNCSQMGSRLV